jgi:FtsH-binding integral membrane protein
MRTGRTLLWKVGLALVAALAFLWPAAAIAAAPPTPTLRKTSPAWVGYAVMFVLVVVVLTISLLPSKRSHQD